MPSDSAYDPGEHLNFSDVAVDSISIPRLLKVEIKVSKTDPFRQEVHILIGKTDNKLCPIAAMLSYLAKRGNHEGMLFHYEDKKLSRDQFVVSMREALTTAGVDCKSYTGHSFRIGATTAAEKCGLPPTTIQTLGRWESTAYLLYVKMSREEFAGVSELIGACNS